jgi:ATP-binding cassette subfamily B protein
VEFDNVWFSYEPGRPVLKGINFQAEPGQTIALVGHTGSGKTSIINLVARFWLPDSGQVRVDGINLRTVTGESLHQQIGIVLQTNFLFAGTVLDNIRLPKPEATLEEVEQVCRQLGRWDEFQSLSHGLETSVGERGAQLSLGQRQMVCFARALLADPKILILDEATSSIDIVTEIRLQQALKVVLKGRTCFVVAHRLSTIREADTILVLEHGEIVERGNHAQLLARHGAYSKLYERFVHAVTLPPAG